MKKFSILAAVRNNTKSSVRTLWRLPVGLVVELKMFEKRIVVK